MYQLVLTALVVVAVAMVWRLVRMGPQRERAASQQASALSTPALVGYGLVGVMVLISAAAFYWQWQAANHIVQVEVTDPATGEAQTYEVRRKAIDDGRRSFETTSGRRVTLGADERVEVMDP